MILRWTQSRARVLVTADIFGDTRLSKLEKGATVRTSRTELQFAKLDGDLTMDSGDLQGNGLLGPFSLSTKAKDVDLRNFAGDVRINDEHGDIALESNSAAALGNLESDNTSRRRASAVARQGEFPVQGGDAPRRDLQRLRKPAAGEPHRQLPVAQERWAKAA